MNKVLAKISNQYNRQHPFVCFRKSKGTTLYAYLCQTDVLNYSSTFEDSGFLFAPFDDREKAIIFPRATSDIFKERITTLPSVEGNEWVEELLTTESEHKHLVSKGVDAIQRGLFSKVVLSRKEKVIPNTFDFLKVFESLLCSYDNAFTYVWYHPKVGMWLGATPERLVSLEKNTFRTMALAGTQAFLGDPDPGWGKKERDEHQYVVDYIVDQIQDPTNGIILEAFRVSDTYTSKAGNLLHLKADIEGEIGDFNLKDLLKTLHPTPAVCGLPKEAAKAFILANENYKRSFYTGFLGEINVNGLTELFVNLRCAEIGDKEVFIYVGGGVTKDSDPNKEWVETIRKTQTIKNVL